MTGDPDIKKMVEAEEFIKKVIHDEKIWDSLQIDTDLISKIFASQGCDVKSLADWFSRSSNVAHVAIDVGVVRFPRLEDPCFKLYRLRVLVFKSTTAVMLWHKSGQGLFCKFTARKYLMSDKFIAKFDEEATKKVNEQFESVMKMFLL